MDLQGFANPDSILRPAPFWAINARITPEETARQMADMIRVGLSGGFFHSRAGLITDYLGDEWFAAMHAALDVARKQDGYLWLYDEDLWPSGNAGGQVAGMKDEYRAATINAYIAAAGQPAPKLSEDQAMRYCYAIKSRDGLRLGEIEPVALDKLDEAIDFERLFIVRTYASKIGWWGGESYANLLHPEAMREFMRLTHEVYLKHLGSEFGKRIPGIFTDEPQISHGPNCLAWWEGIPDVYAKWHGRDFWADLPYMFFDGSDHRKIRLLMHRTILRQFLEAFSKPIYEWCEAHGIEHTGHYMQEDSFAAQIGSHCGSVMAHYRYQHAPGIDHLCRGTDGLLLTCKQVSSVARQLGRPRVLTEIFGVTRHTNTFEDFKWIGDYDLVLGANFFVPHLTWYCAKGRRKRDYPPVWNYQQPYWDELRPLNDYFTRVAHATTRGKAAVDVLILQSIETATAAHRLGVAVTAEAAGRARTVPTDVPTEDTSAMGVYDSAMRKALRAILNAGYDCDIGEESYIEEMGAVEGDRFRIGEMSYKVVVLPPAVTWRPTTFELLKQFVANGGRVLMLGEFPAELDCEDAAAAWAEFAGHENVQSLPCSVEAVQTAIDEIAPSNYTLKGADGTPHPHTYVQHRIDGDQEIFFIVNSDRAADRYYTLTLKDSADKSITLWDAETGGCWAVEGSIQGNDLIFEFGLPPAGSMLLTVGSPVEGAADVADTHETCNCDQEMPAETVHLLDGEWDFERLDPNVLVIDRLSVSYDGGKTFEPEDTDWRVRRRIAEKFGTKAALEWQPWVAIRKGLFDGRGGEIVLRYRFQSDLDPSTSSPSTSSRCARMWAVIEDIWKGELFVNGVLVDTANAEWHWDRAFGKVEITDHVRKGDNTLDFKVNYDFLTEVEPAYVVGDFGVALADPFRGKIVAEPAKLATGSWVDQGYPFYSGRMVYKACVDLGHNHGAILRLIRPSGTLFKVRVNGSDAGRILWRPWEIDLTPHLGGGTNEIEIEVISSLQNAWGPLHEKDGDDNRWCGPNAFEDERFLREEFSLFNYGLLGGAEIVTT